MTTRTTSGDHAVIPWLQAAADPENFLTGVRKGVLFQVPAHELTSDPSAFILTFDVDTEELDHGQPFVIDGVREAEGLVIDGLIYRTAVMPDGREWMVENLQAAQGSATFYNNDEATYGRNGNNYGRLYNWDDAAAVVDRVEGWHLPTSAEWDALADAVGGTSVAGTRLKAASGWSRGNGTDDYGFSVFPAGRRSSVSYFSVGSDAYFWTATGYSSANAYGRDFSTGASMSSGFYSKNSNSFSVRLIKDI